MLIQGNVRADGRLRAVEDGLRGVRVPLRPVLQRRRPGEVRAGAQVRRRPEAGRPPHASTRCVHQWDSSQSHSQSN